MIFARRSIQRFINRLSETLPQRAVEKIALNLNRNDRASLDFEWEAAVLFALNNVGNIEYESDHGGERHADVTLRCLGQEIVSFVADIATVSDSGLEEENPLSLLLDYLQQKAQSLRLCGGFQYRVEGNQVGKRFGNRKVQLAMPNKKQLRSYLDRHVMPQLRTIKESEIENADILISEPYRISITYRRDTSGFSGSYLSYTTAYSLTRNPIYTSLKSKARQLSRTGFKGSKGMILCDGSCDIFRTQPSAGTSAYSKHEIIRDFLRQNTSVAFVATIWVEQPHRGVFDPAQGRRLRFELFQNPAARSPLDDEIAKLLQQIPDLLPTPVNTARSAVYGIKAGKYGIGKTHYGGSQVSFGISSTAIRISSRALLDLLAGTTDPSQFSEDHWPDQTGTARATNNPFAAAVAQGMTIKGVTVQREEDQDDDWITFDLSWPDVATSPFKV